MHTLRCEQRLALYSTYKPFSLVVSREQGSNGIRKSTKIDSYNSSKHRAGHDCLPHRRIAVRIKCIIAIAILDHSYPGPRIVHGSIIRFEFSWRDSHDRHVVIINKTIVIIGWGSWNCWPIPIRTFCGAAAVACFIWWNSTSP